MEARQRLMRHADIVVTSKFGRNSMLTVTVSADAEIAEMMLREEEKAKTERRA